MPAEKMDHLQIAVLAANIANDQRLIAGITDLVNQVYADAEAGLWVKGTTRTTETEIRELIASHQIALAQVDRRPVGCIRIKQLDSALSMFGMLAVHPEHRGEGVGRDLVRFAEELSLRRGLATMQLELLVPRSWSHPIKDSLHDWYTRLGYQPVRTATFEEEYPRLAPLLATPCDFVVYHKPLTTPAGDDVSSA